MEQKTNDALERAIALFRQGRLAEADGQCTAALGEMPQSFEALHLLGIIRAQQGRLAEAFDLMNRAIAVEPGSPEAHKNLALILAGQNRSEEAVAALDRALAIAPDYPEALFNRANILRRLGRHDAALAGFDRLLALAPDHAPTLFGRALSLIALGRLDEALACYDRVLAATPGDAAALFNRGNVLRRLGRLDEAIASYDRALAVQPNAAEVLVNRGLALAALVRWDEALASYDRALAVRPDFVEALNNRGNALFELQRDDEAVTCFDRALALRPDFVEALSNRGNALRRLERYDEALASFDRALAIDPGHVNALWSAAHLRRRICDWSAFDRTNDRLFEQARAGGSAMDPFLLIQITDDTALHLAVGRQFWASRRPGVAPLPPRAPRARDRIRLGYFSAELRMHAAGMQVVELFEMHDRSRFEVLGFSYGRDDGTPIRRRLERAFDSFVDVRPLRAADIARRIHEQEIDVLIDLTGYMTDTRVEVLAWRPAPVQAHYFGYPGPLGADAIDYLLVDPFVVPPDQIANYTEKLVWLPDCYMVSDRKREVAAARPGRGECGLPAESFVFCSFNNTSKITPAVFDVWMRLLHGVPDSVLWLFAANCQAEDNLRREAASRGIDQARVVFAPHRPPHEHLARIPLADLFLDTLPYNAHVTACDALSMGLPIVTCAGRSFASRVAGSLLRCVGLPELVTTSLPDYEALALRLATDRAALAAIRARLAAAIPTAPLFDCERTTRQIEAAYEKMLDLWRQGRAPESFSV